jgi:signal transduction histidine kinase
VASGWIEPAVVAGLALFAALTLLVMLDPRLPPTLVNPALDTVTTTLAMVIAGAVALLSWGRFRVERRSAQLYRAGAFLVLGATSGLTLALSILGLDSAIGLSLEEPGQWPLAVGIVTRSVASILLVLGGLTALQGGGNASRMPGILFVAPALAVVGLALLATASPALPSLIEPAALRALAARPTAAPSGVSALYIVGQLTPAVAFLVAAAFSYLAFHRHRAPSEAMLAIGLVVISLAQVHSAVHPGAFISLVTTGDMLRVLFYVGLLVGVIIENRINVRALRTAHAELRRMRDLELAETTLQERSRLAREIHDGLAQDLWYAKLKQSRLLQLTDLHTDAEARGLAADVATALDSALAEARQAIMALRPAGEGTLLEVLERYVDDFSDRFGIRAQFAAHGTLPQIDARAQAEVLRVVQEALNNVRRHADATLISVEVRNDGETPTIRVTDNGRGFEPATRTGGYGLRSMEERVQLIGGELSVRSAPHDGTTVEVRLAAGDAA